MRSKVYLMGAGICLAAALFTACGGEYAGTTEGNAVSGGTVSGEAVSGGAVSDGAVSDPAVSGPALKDERPEDFVSKKKKSKYQFCNDSHLYYMEDGFPPIMEYDLSDGSHREIKFGEEDRIAAISYVDNDWVWYVKEIEMPVYRPEIWRAPVEDGKLNVKKEEFVFSDPCGMDVEEIYCDGRYVLYMTYSRNKYEVYMTGSSSYYRKYDLKEKKYIFDVTSDENEGGIDTLIAVTGDVAFINGYDGVFRQDLDSSEKVMVTEEGCYERVAVTEKDLFYLEESGEHSCYICQYHLEDGSKKELITTEQIQRFLKEGGFLKVSGKTGSKSSNEWYLDYLFVSGDRLYVQISLERKENGVTVSKKVVLSQKTGSKNELRYEKGLTECLANPKNNQKKFEKIYDDEEDEGEMSLFLSRGTCLYMSGDKCFMELYDPKQDKNRVACYDLSSDSMRFLTKKDPDWYVPFYDGAVPDWAETVYPSDISWDMPNNKKVDWPYW